MPEVCVSIDNRKLLTVNDIVSYLYRGSEAADSPSDGHV